MTATPDSAENAAVAMGILRNNGTSAKLDAGLVTEPEANMPNGASSQPPTDSPGSPMTSDPSTPRSTSSTKPFKRPATVRELAAQVTDLATRVLNGELDGEALDRARVYSSLVRTTAQLVTSEVQRSRFLRAEPDLSLTDPNE